MREDVCHVGVANPYKFILVVRDRQHVEGHAIGVASDLPASSGVDEPTAFCDLSHSRAVETRNVSGELAEPRFVELATVVVDEHDRPRDRRPSVKSPRFHVHGRCFGVRVVAAEPERGPSNVGNPSGAPGGLEQVNTVVVGPMCSFAARCGSVSSSAVTVPSVWTRITVDPGRMDV